MFKLPLTSSPKYLVQQWELEFVDIPSMLNVCSSCVYQACKAIACTPFLRPRECKRVGVHNDGQKIAIWVVLPKHNIWFCCWQRCPWGSKLTCQENNINNKSHVCLGSHIQILHIRKIEIRGAQNVTRFGVVRKITLNLKPFPARFYGPEKC